MPRPLLTYDECRAMRVIMKHFNPVAPGPLYDDDPAVFAEYADKVAKRIREAGFPLVAVDVEQCRDIARCALLEDVR